MLKQIIIVSILSGLVLGSQNQYAVAQQNVATQSEQTLTFREGIGVDAIEINKSTDENVIARFGKDYELEDGDGYSKQIIYKNLGFSFSYYQADREKKIFRIEVFNGTTSKGISVGSTLEDVLKAYGKPKRIIGGFYDYKGIEFEIENLSDNNSDEEQDLPSAKHKVVSFDIVPNNYSFSWCKVD